MDSFAHHLPSGKALSLMLLILFFSPHILKNIYDPMAYPSPMQLCDGGFQSLEWYQDLFFWV